MKTKIDYIREKFVYFHSKVLIENKEGLYDFNKTSEYIVMHLLNSTYGWLLEDANDIKKNFPGIDLIDKKNEIAIQVTSTITTKKLDETIIKFKKSEISKKYNRYQVKIFFIKSKPKFQRKSLDRFSKDGITEKDLLDFHDILDEVKKKPDSCNKVYDRLKKLETGTTMQNSTNNGTQTFNFTQRPLEKLCKNLTVLPAKKKHFIGRTEELQQIEEALASEGILYIVNGIGGIGKTELVEQYLLTHQQKYQHIASFKFSIENNDLKNTLYQVVKKYFPTDKEDNVEQLIHYLQKLPSKCLFVFDDLQKKDDIKKLEVLHHNADILITTRLNIPNVSLLNLDVLNFYDAKTLFLEYYPTNENVNDILEFIDYHTLFIELIAKTLAEDCLDISTLRKQFANGDFVRIERDFERTFNDFLIQRFKIETHEGLKNLLKYLALLPALEIPYEILAIIFYKTIRLKPTLKELAKRGWLSERDNGYKLHQIIREFILENYPLDFEQEFLPVIDHITHHDIMTKIAKSDLPDNNQKDWIFIEIVKSLYNVFPQQPHKKIVGLLTMLSDFYNYSGDYRSGITYQEKALTIAKELWENNHSEIATIYNDLAVLYQAQGNNSQALLLLQKVLNIDEKTPEKEPHYSSYNNLAECYLLEGNYSKALPLFKKAQSICEKDFGTKDPNTAIIYNSLARLYKSQGNYAEALPLYQKALAIREKRLGTGHIDTANSYNDLAGFYESQDNYEAALHLHKKVSEIYKIGLATDHPNIAINYNNMAVCCQSLGMYEPALLLAEKALAINEKSLGLEHPNTANSYNNLAGLHKSLNNYSQALELYQKGIVIYEKTLGVEHSDTARIYSNLGLFYKDEKNYAKALPLLQKALPIREKKLGAKHPTTVDNYVNLVECYLFQGECEKAFPLIQKVWEGYGREYFSIGEYYHTIAKQQFDSKNCKCAKYYAEEALKVYKFEKDIIKVKILLKNIKWNIKKSKKLPEKRKRKYCKK